MPTDGKIGDLWRFGPEYVFAIEQFSMTEIIGMEHDSIVEDGDTEITT